MESSRRVVGTLLSAGVRAVYQTQGYNCSRISVLKIKLLDCFFALYVLQRGWPPFAPNPLKKKRFSYPVRGASCVALLRPQMSESEFGVLKVPARSKNWRCLIPGTHRRWGLQSCCNGTLGLIRPIRLARNTDSKSRSTMQPSGYAEAVGFYNGMQG